MWVPVEERTDHQMVDHAAARTRVQLRSGQKFLLVRWPSSHSYRRGRYARLETGSGRTFTVHCSEIAEVWE